MKPEPERQPGEPKDGWFAEGVRQFFRRYGKPKIKGRGSLMAKKKQPITLDDAEQVVFKVPSPDISLLRGIEQRAEAACWEVAADNFAAFNGRIRAGSAYDRWQKVSSEARRRLHEMGYRSCQDIQLGLRGDLR